VGQHGLNANRQGILILHGISQLVTVTARSLWPELMEGGYGLLLILVLIGQSAGLMAGTPTRIGY
jgi:hypothetical protein